MPRFIIREDASVEDVSSWLISIGHAQYVTRFAKKKVDGFKLFVMTEKKCRKLVKKEDDFVLFKRALRQAVAFADTMPTANDQNSQPVFGSWEATSAMRAPKPYRSMRRVNPLFQGSPQQEHGVVTSLNSFDESSPTSTSDTLTMATTPIAEGYTTSPTLERPSPLPTLQRPSPSPPLTLQHPRARYREPQQFDTRQRPDSERPESAIIQLRHSIDFRSPEEL